MYISTHCGVCLKEAKLLIILGWSRHLNVWGHFPPGCGAGQVGAVPLPGCNPTPPHSTGHSLLGCNQPVQEYWLCTGLKCVGGMFYRRFLASWRERRKCVLLRNGESGAQLAEYRVSLWRLLYGESSAAAASDPSHVGNTTGMSCESLWRPHATCFITAVWFIPLSLGQKMPCEFTACPCVCVQWRIRSIPLLA